MTSTSLVPKLIAERGKHSDPDDVTTDLQQQGLPTYVTTTGPLSAYGFARNQIDAVLDDAFGQVRSTIYNPYNTVFVLLEVASNTCRSRTTSANFLSSGRQWTAQQSRCQGGTVRGVKTFRIRLPPRAIHRTPTTPRNAQANR